jgi:non-specific serine/threonine protein kinase
MTRRLKKDTLGLPDKLPPVVVTLDLHPLQRILYTEASDELQISRPNSPTPMDIENALTKYLYLKQLCNTTAEIEGYEDVSTKLDWLEEHVPEFVTSINDVTGEPVVIWTQFLVTQACIKRRMEALGLTVFQLNGGVKMERRQEVVKEWSVATNSKGQRAVLVAMIQVAGVGLNMTQASSPIFVDRLYVPKLNEQAEDRHHRIGTTKPVQPYILVCRNTVEQRIEQILRQKRKLFNSIVEDSSWKRALYQAIVEETEKDMEE